MFVFNIFQSANVFSVFFIMYYPGCASIFNHPVFAVTVPFVIQDELLYKTEFEYCIKGCLVLKLRSQVCPYCFEPHLV